MTKVQLIVNTLLIAAFAQGSFASAATLSNVYVSNLSGNSVSVINPVTNTVSTTISIQPTGINPAGLDVSPDGTTVFVACESSKNVAVINTTTNAVSFINLTAEPNTVAFTPDGKHAYAVEPALNQIVEIDAISKAVVTTIAAGSRPTAVAFNPTDHAGTIAFVTNFWSKTVSVVNTSSHALVHTITTGSGPSSVAVTPDGKHLYVTNSYSNTVDVYDATTYALLRTITGFIYPTWVSFSPDSTKAYIVNENASTVSVISNSTYGSLATISTGMNSLPTSIAVSADGTRGYVTNELVNTVSVMDLTHNTLLKTIYPVGVYPVAAATKN
jgi:YVTN family beta-propeller protein